MLHLPPSVEGTLGLSSQAIRIPIHHVRSEAEVYLVPLQSFIPGCGDIYRPLLNDNIPASIPVAEKENMVLYTISHRWLL
jgi:hypothetical protein